MTADHAGDERAVSQPVVQRLLVGPVRALLDPAEVRVPLVEPRVEHGRPDAGAREAHVPEDVGLQDAGDLAGHGAQQAAAGVAARRLPEVGASLFRVGGKKGER